MSKLSDELRNRIKSEGTQQKEIATRFHELLGDAPGAIRFETVPPKLSKLLAGDPEGERFFLDDAPRAKALAEALGTTVEELRALRAVRTLVLDPELDSAAVAYFVGAAARPGAGHACVQVTREATVAARDALRAKAKDNPGAVVVLANGKDDLFYEGAAIETTLVEKRPLGWVLVKAKELVPLPPSPPPRMFDGDGWPMMPCETVAAELRKRNRERNQWYGGSRGDADPEVAHVLACDERGELPTFRIEGKVAEQLSQVSGASAVPTGPKGSLGARVWWNAVSDGQGTYWWFEGVKVFAAGPGVAKLVACLAPYHAVTAIDDDAAWATGIAEWKAGFDRWNPWRLADAGSPAVTLRKRVFEACGLEVGASSDDDKKHAAVAQANWEPKDDPAVEPIDDVAIAEARGVLTELAKRCMEGEAALALPFVLEQASSAPLRLLRRTEQDRVHVVVNLGAGRWLRVRARFFPGEVPRYLEALPRKYIPNGRYERWDMRDRYDGGDVRLWLDRGYEELLEGVASPARARRAREAEEAEAAEARRQQEDDDD